MPKWKFVSLAAIASVVALIAWRFVGDRVVPPPPDPDRALASALAHDLDRIKGRDGLVTVVQTSRDSTPSLYNSAHLLAASRLVGAPIKAPTDATLAAQATAPSSVDPLWTWEWACTASGDGRVSASVSDTAPLRKRLAEIVPLSSTSSVSSVAADDAHVSDLISAATVSRCLGLKSYEEPARRQLQKVSTVTPEQAVRLHDLGLGAPEPTATPATDDCARWDPVQDTARWLLARQNAVKSDPPPCVHQPFEGLADPQAIYWSARAGAFDADARAVAAAAVASWKPRLLSSGMVAESPSQQGSLLSTVLASQLFDLLGAAEATPSWIRASFTDHAVGTSGPASDSTDLDADHRTRQDLADNETILLGLGCRAVAAECPDATSRASELLRRPLPEKITTAGQARQWIMVTGARGRFGIQTTERAVVEPSSQSWTERGPVRTRLAAVLCQIGQCGTAATMGAGEPMALAKEALAGNQLELATALFQLQDGRQIQTTPQQIDEVRGLLSRYRAPGTTALFSWTPGGTPSMAATHAVYESALWLGVPVSDLVTSGAAAPISSPEEPS